MIFVLGLLAFVQITFLPGYLLLETTGFSIEGKLRKMVYGFGLSLLLNYLGVFLLTAAGLYKPLTLYFILAAEGGLAVYLLLSRPPGKRYVTLDTGRWAARVKNFLASRPLLYNLLLLGALAVVMVHVFYFFYFLGTVFEHWDPVTGWNRFAVDWAAGRFPTDTWRYPQMLPANWSVTYVAMQSTGVQFFAKSLQPLFSLAILLLFLDLGLRTKRAAYLLGAVIYGGLLIYLFGPSYIASGYVDTAVSFFAFLSFHALHRTDGRRGIWFAVIFASAAAVTKQAGMFILAVVLVWVLIRLFRAKEEQRGEEQKRKKPVVIALLMLFTAILITVPWYLLKEVQIKKGLDQSEIQMVQQANVSTDYVKRFGNALEKVATHRHPKFKYFIYAGILLLLLGLFHPHSRAAALFIAIPFALIWAFLFSYDFRNLSLAIPFIAFSSGFGAALLKRPASKLTKIPAFNAPVPLLLLGFLAVLLLLNFTVFTNDTLIRNQDRKKMSIGDKELNGLLYDYHKTTGITGKIATNYQYLKHLPGLTQFYRYKPGRVNTAFLDYLDTAEGNNIHYLLVPYVLKSEKKTFQRIREKLRSGQYKMIFKCKGYRFIKVSAAKERQENQPKAVKDRPKDTASINN